MARLRSGSGTGDDKSKSSAAADADKKNVKPASVEKAQIIQGNSKGKRKTEAQTAGPSNLIKQRKKNSQEDESTAAVLAQKKELTRKTTLEAKSRKQTPIKEKDQKRKNEERPRLSTPDIEFEWDRSQLRDPRSTPGRVRKLRYEQGDIPPDLEAELSVKFQISKPEKPKGRLKWVQKDDLSKQESLMNPLHCFHNLNKCLQKGREGSPTYDNAGFQLDWEKVKEWDKPTSRPNKTTMFQRTQREFDKEAVEEKEMYHIFFRDNQVATGSDMMDYVKDHVSKDLGLAWHQIGLKEFKQWKAKGFEKKQMTEWWHLPNEVEQKRMSKMHAGCLLRNDL